MDTPSPPRDSRPVVLFVIAIVLSVGIALAILGTSNRNRQEIPVKVPESFQSSELTKISNYGYMRYVRDSRSGLCFTLFYRGDNVSSVEVPCDKVKKLLSDAVIKRHEENISK